MNRVRVYLEEFPVNEEGLLLVDDLELIAALRRRAKRRECIQGTRVTNETQTSVKPTQT